MLISKISCTLVEIKYTLSILQVYFICKVYSNFYKGRLLDNEKTDS